MIILTSFLLSCWIRLRVLIQCAHIWNPTHMDRILQNCIYVSEHVCTASLPHFTDAELIRAHTTWSPQHSPCTCTMYIHCMYMFIQCIYMYIRCTWALLIISITPYGVYHCCVVCTALVIGMYYAIIQELVILCIEVSDRDIPPRNG